MKKNMASTKKSNSTKITAKSARNKALQTSKLKTKKKSRTKKKKKIRSAQEIEQSIQMKEIRSLMANIGFNRAPGIDGKEFVYEGRPSELDDIFFYENIVILAEYTVNAKPGDHLKNKKIIYDLINNDPHAFLSFILQDEKFKPFKEALLKYSLNTSKYTLKQMQIRIVYASKALVVKEHKDLVSYVRFLDYSVVKYFESISKIIKKSARYEFFHFLDLDFNKVGENIKSSKRNSTDDFSGHILPEEHSAYADGYKIVSFYIDAESLLKRSYVLRKDGWRNKDNVVGFYQRMFLSNKIKSMRKYLHEKKRVFINNIIVTLPIEKIKLIDEHGNELKVDPAGNFKSGSNTNVMPATIKIENSANLIGIIDGQHRSYAYHEGDDVYEKTISTLRGIQNLLVTGIIYPRNEPEEKRIKFEAELFLEINSNQSGASASLKQEIEFMLSQFSTVSIAKYIINKLNESGPLGGMFEEFWFEKSKLKTASIISFGLKPLIKFEGVDTLVNVWNNPKKNNLNKKNDFTLLRSYKEFCTEEVRNIFIGLKSNVSTDAWKIDRNDSNAILNVTTINGIINCLRILVENNKTGDVNYYKQKFSKVGSIDFKKYKSSQYRKMGEDIYKLCFQ